VHVAEFVIGTVAVVLGVSMVVFRRGLARAFEEFVDDLPRVMAQTAEGPFSVRPDVQAVVIGIVLVLIGSAFVGLSFVGG
jgi:hypothetical protein